MDGKPLHGVVNNAGISAFGDVEWASINVYKRVSYPSDEFVKTCILANGHKCMGSCSSDNGDVATYA